MDLLAVQGLIQENRMGGGGGGGGGTYTGDGSGIVLIIGNTPECLSQNYTEIAGLEATSLSHAPSWPAMHVGCPPQSQDKARPLCPRQNYTVCTI